MIIIFQLEKLSEFIKTMICFFRLRRLEE